MRFHATVGLSSLLLLGIALWQVWRKQPAIIEEHKNTYRPLAEAELQKIYQTRQHESLLLEQTQRVWEQEHVAMYKGRFMHYEWIVILQNRQGQYFWFRYKSNAPTLFKQTDASIVQVLSKGQALPATTSPSSTIKAQTWNLSK